MQQGCSRCETEVSVFDFEIKESSSADVNSQEMSCSVTGQEIDVGGNIHFKYIHICYFC